MLRLGWMAALAVMACSVHADEEGRTVALATLADGGVAVLDTVEGKLLRRIDGLTDATFGIVVNPRNPAQAWATGEKTGQLFELDLSKWEVRGEPIALSGDPGRPVTAHQPVTTTDGNYVLVSVPGDHTLTVVDTTTRAVSKVPMPDDPHIVDIDLATGHVFVSRRGAKRGATFLDFPALAARFDLPEGVVLGPADVEGLAREGLYVEIPINGAPRTIRALGQGRFSIALYGKRGPVHYEVKDGKVAFLDDLDNLIASRPRSGKSNLEFLEAMAISADGRTLAGTDQGIPPCLRVWTLDESGRGVKERAAFVLPAEPYWVCLSSDGHTAWITIPKRRDAEGREVTGSVLAVDMCEGRVVHEVNIDDDGRVHSPKRMILVDLPASFLAPVSER